MIRFFLTVFLILITVPVINLNADSQEQWLLNPSELLVTQVYSDLPECFLSCRLSDIKGSILPVSDVKKMQISVNGKEIKSKNVSILKRSDTALTLILDVSMSVKRESFENVKKFVDSILQNLGKKDYVMLILAGDRVEVKLDFTNDFEKVSSVVNNLKIKANNTLLFDSLNTAFKQNKAKKSGIPEMRSVIIFTDGKDEGSGVNSDDLCSNVSIPVYPVIYNNGKKTYSAVFKKVATESRGHYFHLNAMKLAAEAGAECIKIIKSHSTVLFRIYNSDFIDRSVNVSLTYKSKNEYKSDFKTRLSSTKTKKQIDAVYKAILNKEKPAEPEKNESFLIYIISGVVAVLIISTTIIFAGLKKKKLYLEICETEDEDLIEQFLSGYPKSKYTEHITKIRTDIAKRKEKEKERLIQLESGNFEDESKEMHSQESVLYLNFAITSGKGKGEIVTVKAVSETFIIGSSQKSEFMIDDAMISGEHARVFSAEKDRRKFWIIEDLNSTNGTYVNGVKVDSQRKIERGDVIWAGQSKFRFMGEVNE